MSDETNNGKARRRASAEAMAKAQKEISVSEFFEKNRHLLAPQLFVYPAVTSTTRGGDSGFDVIDLLFRILSWKNDPWVQLRCVSLAKSVFNDLILSLKKPKINLLDLGCGSAQTSMRLCTQAHTDIKRSFDVSLVDTIPSRFSIARSFYNNSQAFEAIRYRRSDLFDWVFNMRSEATIYDITLLSQRFP